MQDVSSSDLEDRKPARHACQRSRPDWPAIERDWHEGRLSLREMAARHGCAHSTIANKATREGWPRRLRAAAEPLGARPTDAPTDLFTHLAASSLR